MYEQTSYWIVFYPIANVTEMNTLPIEELKQSKDTLSEEDHYFCEEKNSEFWKCFQKEVEFMNEKFGKKVWTEEEDLLLTRLREEGYTWRAISKAIPDTKDQICKRRYQKIRLEQKKWPRQVDNFVKYCFEVLGLSWSQIFSELRSKFNISRKKKLQKIKTRYKLYLSSSICKEQWSFQEDCYIVNYVNRYGNKWRNISEIFKNRTQLQIKNRYYGTLQPIESKILRQLQAQQNNTDFS